MTFPFSEGQINGRIEIDRQNALQRPTKSAKKVPIRRLSDAAWNLSEPYNPLGLSAGCAPALPLAATRLMGRD